MARLRHPVFFISVSRTPSRQTVRQIHRAKRRLRISLIAPWSAMAFPGAGEAFTDELFAKRGAVAKDFAQVAAVTVVITAECSKFERTGVEKFE